ncbi:MAG TPA: polysaccharide deacetylase family protein [Actinomycetota bacterium]|nr:polysaccharide deacetylase family protein [Actinomycetota bacterium]
MTRGLPQRAALGAVVFLFACSAPLLVAAELEDRPPPIAISVGGVEVLADPHATFGDVVHERSLRAPDGRLLDVEGGVIDPHADPGGIWLNGTAAARSTPLTDGDAIVVVPGTDRVEGTRRVVQPLPGQQLQNPMRTLATSRMQRVTTEGRVSGIVVDVRYRPIGRSNEPPSVALTFDDGPWPHGTVRVLGILQRMRVQATFFMVGYLMERYPQVVERVRDAGMAIGTHSWAHPYVTPFVDLSPHRQETEVARPADLLRTRFGVAPTLFRPPGGSVDPSVVRAADRNGMRVALWDVDPHDYRASARPRAIAKTVLHSIRPGSIVLLHDGGGDQTATIRALPRIIRGIRHMGLEPVAIRS